MAELFCFVIFGASMLTVALLAEAFPWVVDDIADALGFGGLPNWME